MLIKIFGGKSEGKTTIAKLIENVLKEHGLQVENSDEDSSERFSENLEIIKKATQEGDPLKVEIKTILYGRESIPRYAVRYNQNQKSLI